MNENNNIRPLTAEEKAEWLVEFLEQQVEMYTEELEVAKVKLKTLKGENNGKRISNKRN